MSPTYELIRMTAFNGSDKHKRELNDGNCFFSVSSCLTWFYTMVFFCFFLYFVYLWKWELLSAKANDKYFGRLQFVFIESKSDWYLSIQLKLTHTDRMNRKLNYTATTGQKNNANEIIEMNYDCLPFTLFAVNTKASILLGSKPIGPSERTQRYKSNSARFTIRQRWGRTVFNIYFPILLLSKQTKNSKLKYDRYNKCAMLRPIYREQEH